MLLVADIDTLVLCLIYYIWDSMIESEKIKITFDHEKDFNWCLFNLFLMLFTKFWRVDGTKVILLYIVCNILWFLNITVRFGFKKGIMTL